MKFLEMAEKVLLETKKPMSASEIWDFAATKGYVAQLETKGSTPKATLGARLYMAIYDASNEKFATVGVRPKRFYLMGDTPTTTINHPEVFNPEPEVSSTPRYKEKDLHCVLCYFARTHLNAFAKTINHSVSKKKEFGEWTHPDMVACYFPRHHWKTNVYELSELVGDVQLALFSFEIKQKLSFGNLRESFFQAVSNSSWAHEGYLAAADIDIDLEFRQELGRLSNAFGIGVISLDLDNPDNSEIIFEADQTDHIDWDTVHKLASMNKDFEDFLSRVKNDVSSKEVREEWYDRLMDADDIVKKFKV